VGLPSGQSECVGERLVGLFGAGPSYCAQSMRGQDTALSDVLHKLVSIKQELSCIPK